MGALRARSVNILLKCMPLQPGGAGASRHHAAHVEGPCLNVQAQAEPRKPAVGEGHLRKWGPEVNSGEWDTGAEDTHPPPPAWT